MRRARVTKHEFVQSDECEAMTAAFIAHARAEKAEAHAEALAKACEHHMKAQSVTDYGFTSGEATNLIRRALAAYRAEYAP